MKMIHRFDTYLLHEDGTYQTQVVNGEGDIVIRDEKQTYDYDEIVNVVKRAYFTERSQYGWEVKFLDADGQHKTLFIRSSYIETCNDTTSEKQTIYEWIEHIYERADKQGTLF